MGTVETQVGCSEAIQRSDLHLPTGLFRRFGVRVPEGPRTTVGEDQHDAPAVGVRSGSNPRPSSVTSKVSSPSCAERRTRALVAWAYFATFCSASRQQKYTAASASCG